MNPFIELNFYFMNNKYIKYFKLQFQKSKVEINNTEYKINLEENLFKNNRYKALLSLKLYAEKEEGEFQFYVYKHENHAYIRLDSFFDNVYELIICSKINYKIIQVGKIFEKLDSLENKYRKRLLLINTRNLININGVELNLHNIAGSNFEINKRNPDFYQISAQFDNDDNLYYIVQNIKELNNELNINDLKYNLDNYNNFMTELEKIIKNENIILDYKNLTKRHRYIFNNNFKIPELSRDNNYLETLFKENDMTNLDDFFNIYFIECILKNNSIIYNKEFLSKMLFCAKSELKNLKEMKIDFVEKIRILITIFIIYNLCESISDFDKLKIKYYPFSETKTNSILYKVKEFFNNFIDLLTEDSKIFNYLLQIDSGIGYYQYNKVYTFDLRNVDMLKNNSKKLFPKGIIIYNLKEKKDGIALYSKKAGLIAINEIYITKIKYYGIDYNSDNPKILEDKLNNINNNSDNLNEIKTELNNINNNTENLNEIKTELNNINNNTNNLKVIKTELNNINNNTNNLQIIKTELNNINNINNNTNNVQIIKNELNNINNNTNNLQVSKNDLNNINNNLDNLQISKNDLNNINNNIENLKVPENEMDNIAMNIVIFLFHEYLGHKKFSFSEDEAIEPKNIVKNNQLITLKNVKKYKKNKKNVEYILTSSKKDHGDSGHFLELCFNKFNDENIFKLLIKLKEKGELIKRPDLFASNSLNILEKFIILKIISENQEIKLKYIEKLSIEDEIKYLESKIDLKKHTEEPKILKNKKDIINSFKITKYKKKNKNDINSKEIKELKDFNNTEENEDESEEEEESKAEEDENSEVEEEDENSEVEEEYEESEDEEEYENSEDEEEYEESEDEEEYEKSEDEGKSYRKLKNKYKNEKINRK